MHNLNFIENIQLLTFAIVYQSKNRNKSQIKYFTSKIAAWSFVNNGVFRGLGLWQITLTNVWTLHKQKENFFGNVFVVSGNKKCLRSFQCLIMLMGHSSIDMLENIIGNGERIYVYVCKTNIFISLLNFHFLYWIYQSTFFISVKANF